MNGESNTGKYGCAQRDPKQYSQCPARVLAHVAQTEPDKKLKEEEYVLHGEYFI